VILINSDDFNPATNPSFVISAPGKYCLCEDINFASNLSQPQPQVHGIASYSRAADGTVTLNLGPNTSVGSAGPSANIVAGDKIVVEIVTGGGASINTTNGDPTTVLSATGTTLTYNLGITGTIAQVGPTGSNSLGLCLLYIKPLIAISIASSDVTLDLCGHTLKQTNTTMSTTVAVKIEAGANNVEVVNGSISQFSTAGVWAHRNHDNLLFRNLRMDHVGYLGTVYKQQTMVSPTADTWAAGIILDGNNGFEPNHDPALFNTTTAAYLIKGVQIEDVSMFDIGTLQRVIPRIDNSLAPQVVGESHVTGILGSGFDSISVKNYTIDGLFGRAKAWSDTFSDGQDLVISNKITNNMMSNSLSKGGWARRVLNYTMLDSIMNNITVEVLENQSNPPVISFPDQSTVPGAEGSKIESNNGTFRRCDWNYVRSYPWPLNATRNISTGPGWANYGLLYNPFPGAGVTPTTPPLDVTCGVVEDCSVKYCKVYPGIVNVASNQGNGIHGFNLNPGAGRNGRVSRCVVQHLYSPLGPVVGYFVLGNAQTSDKSINAGTVIKDCVAEHLYLNSNINGTNAYVAGYQVDNALPMVENCRANDLKAISPATLAYGIRVLRNCNGATLQNNNIRYCTTSGISLQNVQANIALLNTTANATVTLPQSAAFNLSAANVSGFASSGAFTVFSNTGAQYLTYTGANTITNTFTGVSANVGSGVISPGLLILPPTYTINSNFVEFCGNGFLSSSSSSPSPALSNYENVLPELVPLQDWYASGLPASTSIPNMVNVDRHF